MDEEIDGIKWYDSQMGEEVDGIKLMIVKRVKK